MLKSKLTFEGIDAIVSKANLKSLRVAPARVQAATMDAKAADVLGTICAAWKVARPIVMLLLALPFIPKKWKAALEVFIKLLDSICGTS